MMNHVRTGGPDPLNSLWAKLPRDKAAPPSYHPLLAHLIDVAQVAHAMWRTVLPQAACETIAAELGVDAEAAGRWVALWAGAHDVGKASPAFARQNDRAWARIQQAGFECPIVGPVIKAPHGTVTAWALPSILIEDLGVPKALSRQIGRLVGGHHGVFARTDETRAMAKHPEAVGRTTWQPAREQLTVQLAPLLGVDGTIPDSARLSNWTIMYLAGLVSVADWIGSNTEYFEYAVPDTGPATPIDAKYAGKAAAQACKALRELGWLAWSPPSGRPTFTELFPSITTPNRLQHKIVEVAERLDGPSLVVIEAPMGEGKTEAALFLADRWGEQLGQRGLYVALPTQATSNQMFGRVRRFLEHRHPGETLNFQLLHGHAALSAELEALRQKDARAFQPSDIHDEDPGHADAAVVAAEWFTYRKRGLLAPFGVGTVDQALLAILRTRHGFVRLFGLGHKTIVVDEVHAYDTYMTTLLERLLEWLGALGASVVLLSATLPRRRLEALTAAYAAGRGVSADLPDRAKATPYPRISWVSGNGADACEIPASGRTAQVQIKRQQCQLPTLAESRAVDAPPFPLGEQLAETLRPGGCAAVICTTVGRAQRMYAALDQTFKRLPADERPELSLFHARYRFGERDEREKKALVRFGKEGETVVMPDGQPKTVERPQRAVIVATQVIEQSLDLDFDLMVSEMAPVDLLLQRLGRLHRHARPERPSHLSEPTLWLLEPATENDAPVFERDQQFVYHSHVLLRSWLALEGRTAISIPDNVEHLVERVYDDRECPVDAVESVQEAWTVSAGKLAKLRQEEAGKARTVVFVEPRYPGDVFELFNPKLEEDAPSLHHSLQAQTRLAEPSVQMMLLLPAEENLADLGTERPDIGQVRHLLERSATLSHRGLVHYLFGEGAEEALPPASWRRSALLRHHRLLTLDADGCAEVGKYRVRLDDDLGILIERSEQSR